MSDESQRVQSIFDAALNAESERRATVLAQLCKGDKALRARVEELLAAHDAAPDSFLDDANIDLDVAAFADAPSEGLESEAHLASHIRDQIGPYEIERPLGTGGMGAVYLAQQREPIQRPVALKVIKLGMDTERVVARFEAERQALALMDSPYIAKVFDAGATESGRPFFAMEYVEGTAITEYCDQNRYSVADRVALLSEVCDGVQHAHQKGIVHRDLKPSNVLVKGSNGNSTPKIIDFGIAKAMSGVRLRGESVHTAPGGAIGTPEYMSPEQANAALDVDTRTDVYALGIILYELLVGLRPFAPDTDTSGLTPATPQTAVKPSTRLGQSGQHAAIAEQRRTNAATLIREVSGDLDWIALRAIEHDRDRRYATASDMAEDLRRYLRNEPVLATPPSRIYKLSKFARRNRVLVVLSTITVLVLILATVTSTVLAYRESQAREAADVERSIAEAVNAFLNDDVLSQASPYHQPDRNITLREVLDRAAEGVGERFAGRPLVEGRLRMTIGKAYRALGEHTVAAPQFDAALKLHRESLGPLHSLTIDSLQALAGELRRNGEIEEALTLLEEAVELCERAFGEVHDETLQSVSQLGAAYRAQDRLSDAEPLYRRALDINIAKYGENHEASANFMNSFALMLQQKKSFDEAEVLFVKAVRFARQELGREHPHTLTYVANLGRLYAAQKRVDEAVPLLSEAIEIRTKLLGPNNRQTLISKHSLAFLHWKNGDPATAAEMYVDIVSGARESIPDNWLLGTFLGGQAYALLDTNRLAEAEAAFLESYEIIKKTYGADHFRAQKKAEGLIEVYEKWGKEKQAADWRAKLDPQK
ncbi:MAG: serine/threonine-protein kinase [Planctomycetota bacterium]